MARKPKSAPPAPTNVSKDTFIEFLTDLDNTKQRVADAQTTHARAFKKSESLGIHPEAVKLIQRLAKMSPEKRDDLLRAFDKYRSFMAWGAQLDLLEDALQADGADEIEEEIDADDAGLPFDIDDGDEEGGQPRGLDFTERQAGEGEEDEQLGAEWDAGDLTGAEEHADSLDQAGFVFAEGEKAGRDGASPEDSPHEAGSPSAVIWERGRAKGASKCTPGEGEDPMLDGTFATDVAAAEQSISGRAA